MPYMERGERGVIGGEFATPNMTMEGVEGTAEGAEGVRSGVRRVIAVDTPPAPVIGGAAPADADKVASLEGREAALPCKGESPVRIPGLAGLGGAELDRKPPPGETLRAGFGKGPGLGSVWCRITGGGGKARLPVDWDRHDGSGECCGCCDGGPGEKAAVHSSLARFWTLACCISRTMLLSRIW